MTGTALRATLAGAFVMIGVSARADEPILPAPRPLMGEVVGPVSYVRPDPYAVWQNYAVDRRGHWRPLVVPSYDGPRYLATGDPYPWWKEHQRSFESVMANPATFGGPQGRPVVIPPPESSWARMPYAED
jgi:hypothetical protein